MPGVYPDKPLPLRLYDEFDEEEELWIKPRLEALVKGDLTPSQAAVEFDTMLTEDTNRKHDKLMKRTDPRNLTPEEEGQGANMYTIMPHPRIYIGPMFSSISRLCSAFPPYHEGQTRIVEFLLALRSLPRHEIFKDLPPEDPNEPYPTLTLWPFEERSWEECYPPFRWRNFNSAMARLASSNLCDCDFLSSLDDILPSSSEYPDLKKRPIDGPNKIGNYLVGAAQWIMWPDEGRYVYQQCKKVESVSEPREMWSMECWREWKNQFAFVAGDDRFAERYREVAEQSYRQMLVYESEDTA
ncbi:uncharacterized protein ASPGLDRAFT_72654 [Aspergillus glaucus CBS 516.65]|uniref:Uncharacterized protein n=1 Tax=Aspergillus glaucus CBS 516.65 TaxID=1160497 RepID=A0A1L9VR00_ASPGL|nr:hypothetical protein ASPGLDRAFT_72654 [Aspergillus glaucus CBS 516.65]OJJ86310.1 hypothetical protein ASPGLDRAFT_72654 [Aspergillus glaucus CBS 516.65]